MLRSLRVGRWLGISIGISWTWLVVFGFTIWALAVWLLPSHYPDWTAVLRWLIASVCALLLFGSVAVHEAIHSLVCRSCGLRVRSVTLFVFGGISDVQESVGTPAGELIQAAVGPLTNIGLGVASGALVVALAAVSQAATAILTFLAVSNLLLGLMNLAPGLPLDGGRLLRSILWFLSENRGRGTRVAVLVGQIVSWGLVISGALLGITTNLVWGVPLILAGWCTGGVSGASYLRAVRNEARWGS